MRHRGKGGGRAPRSKASGFKFSNNQANATRAKIFDVLGGREDVPENFPSKVVGRITKLIARRKHDMFEAFGELLSKRVIRVAEEMILGHRPVDYDSELIPSIMAEMAYAYAGEANRASTFRSKRSRTKHRPRKCISVRTSRGVPFRREQARHPSR